MTSRFRGPSVVKDTPKDNSFAKGRAYLEPEYHEKPYKNGSRENRYHFGMLKHDKYDKQQEKQDKLDKYEKLDRFDKFDRLERNGHETKEVESRDDPDLLYKRSREHFASWDIKDIVQEENTRKSRKSQEEKYEDGRLSNGKIKTDLKHDSKRIDHQIDPKSRDEGYVGSLNREDRKKDKDIHEKVHGISHNSRKKEMWEEDESRSRSRTSKSNKINENKDESRNRNEKDILDLENPNTEGRSPDRRIRAMIERFKTHEESKTRSRKDRRSPSQEPQELRNDYLDKENTERIKSTKNDLRIVEPEDRTNDRTERFKIHWNDREDDRRTSRSKIEKDSEKIEHEDHRRGKSADRSIDRKHRNDEKFDETNFFNKNYESKRTDSFSKKSDLHKNEIDRSESRRSREIEEDHTRTRESPKRRNYIYEGSPEDFDIKIQKYERTLVEPRRDLDSYRKPSTKESSHDSFRKDSFKEHDRDVTRKSSFKTNDRSRRSVSRDRDSSLGRKSSFKDHENDIYRKNSFRTETTSKYPLKDEENDLSRRNLKDHEQNLSRKNSLKAQNAEKFHEQNKISFKNPNEEPRKNSFKDHSLGSERISFKEDNTEYNRKHFTKDPDTDGRISFKDRKNESSRRNSNKDSAEFNRASFVDQNENSGRKNSAKDLHTESGRVSFKDQVYVAERKNSFDDRYVDFSKVSLKNDEEDLVENIPKDRDHEITRKSSFKEHARTRSSSRNRDEDFDRKHDRHSRPLTPPWRDEHGRSSPEDNNKDRKGFSAWYENNRQFSTNYLRENSKIRDTSEDRLDLDRDRSPEKEFRELNAIKGFDSDDEDSRFEKSHRSRVDSSRLNHSSRGRDIDTRVSLTHERNGTTIIRIRGSPEESSSPSHVERRRRRRPQELRIERLKRYDDEMESDEDDEDAEEDLRRRRSRRDALPSERAGSTPSRRLWNYREGGVLITDVEEGQPCLQCGGTCPGFSPHTWRKNCTSCKCPREAHDVCHEEWVSVRSRLGLKADEPTTSIGFDPRERGLAWAPPGLPPDKVEEYFSMLPELYVPRLGTPGERYRDRQLAIQLPKQDLARAYCRHLDPKHSTSADDFMAARNEIALDIGSVQEVLEKDVDCGSCLERLHYGTLAVSASKLGLLYHPSCFRCTGCNELLVDLAYCVHDDALFCERHYAEQLKPRCAACDESQSSEGNETRANRENKSKKVQNVKSQFRKPKRFPKKKLPPSEKRKKTRPFDR